MKHLLLLLVFSGLSLFVCAQSADIRVYPNPTTDFIQVNDNPSIETVAVYNLAGMQVRTFAFVTDKRYYVGDLPKGMYLVQLLGRNRERLVTKRLNIR